MDRCVLSPSLRRALIAALVAAATSLAALLAGPATPTANAATCAGAYRMPTWGHAHDAARTLVCLVNQERARRGLRALRRNLRLARSAERHSVDMVRRGYFSHVSPGGSGLVQRISGAGYLAGARSWTAGENIAWGAGVRATPYQIHRALMNSPGHRQNILSPRYREIGIGTALGMPARGLSLPGATYTQDFGARSG